MNGNRKQLMKVNLCESLRYLMLHNVFEKITIKKICDESGVIRATFYNYFIDKYDCLNSIVYYDLIEQVYNNHSSEEIIKLITLLVNKIEEQKQFYRLALTIKDTNEIDKILYDNLKIVLVRYLEDHNLQNDEPVINDYFANSLLFLIKRWLMNDYNMNTEDVITYFEKFSDSSFLGIYKRQ